MMRDCVKVPEIEHFSSYESSFAKHDLLELPFESANVRLWELPPLVRPFTFFITPFGSVQGWFWRQARYRKNS
jgi:hypothetical protein